jgi:hypothetical protein
MASKFVWNVSKPKPLSDRVRYCCGGIIGIWNVNPRMYSGLDTVSLHPPSSSTEKPGFAYQRSKSLRLCHRSLKVMGSRLCMSLLLGSSRRTRFTMIFSSLEDATGVSVLSHPLDHVEAAYRSVNQPFLPRNQLAVWHGPAGISRKDNMPTTSVNRPYPPRQPCSAIETLEDSQGPGVPTSIRNNHLQPEWPWTPRMCKMPYASRDDKISAMLMAVQKKPSRNVNSWCL